MLLFSCPCGTLTSKGAKECLRQSVKRYVKYGKHAALHKKELGEKAGIAEPTIRRYELGKLNPKIETVKKIADALGVDMNALYGDLVWDAVNNGLVSAGIERRMIADSSTEILEDSVKIQSYLSILTKAGRAKALERVYELTEIQRYVKFPLGSPAAKVEPPDAAPDAAGSAADDAAEDEPKE